METQLYRASATSRSNSQRLEPRDLLLTLLEARVPFYIAFIERFHCIHNPGQLQASRIGRAVVRDNLVKSPDHAYLKMRYNY